MKSSTTARCTARPTARQSSDSRKHPTYSARALRRALREAFRLQSKRRQRQSDGTISLEGVRFEIPARYRHFRDVVVRYARWDLGRVHLVDANSGATLAPIYPLDRRANADGQRLLFPADTAVAPTDDSQRPDNQMPPLLKRILAEYSATGTPPAYLPKQPHPPNDRGEEA